MWQISRSARHCTGRFLVRRSPPPPAVTASRSSPASLPSVKREFSRSVRALSSPKISNYSLHETSRSARVSSNRFCGLSVCSAPIQHSNHLRVHSSLRWFSVLRSSNPFSIQLIAPGLIVPDGRLLHRDFSTRSGQRRRGSKNFQLDALTFSISPEEATDSFRKWAEDDQGLGYLMQSDSLLISAAYVPMWSFDMNVRFVVTNEATGSKRYDWKPSAFGEAYRGTNSNVLHISGLSAYAGYDYRRSLVQPVHSTTLVFLGDDLQPFGSWMLRDMRLVGTGDSLPVTPDAWNAPRGHAFGVVYDELQTLAQADAEEGNTVQVQTEVTRSRRVMMPTYVFTYSILGLEYQAFVSGCDAGAAVSGMSHQVFADDSLPTARDVSRSSQAFLMNAGRFIAPVARFLPQLLRPILTVLTVILTRIWTKIPIVGLAGALFAGVRKILQPYFASRTASAHWERQREAEAAGGDSHVHFQDFVDTSGAAQRFYVENKERIRRSLSGEEDHTEGDFDWYADWEAWARQQWAQQQRQQQQQQQQQQTYGRQQQQTYGQEQQQQRTQRSKPKPEYHWDFDPNDPYSVLGIQRGATKSEVSAAFRKQMLKHHPDTQPNASEAQKERNVERSKYITEAYRKVQSDLKRQKR